MPNSQSRGLFIFQNDLRLTDNLALSKLMSECDALTCVFFIPEWWYQQNAFACRSMGEHRQAFLNEALVDLDNALRRLGNRLCVVQGNTNTKLSEVIDEIEPTHIGFNHVCGVYERRFLDSVEEIAKSRNIATIQASNSTLYTHEDLPFELDNMPNVFSPFRRKVEKYASPRTPIAKPDSFPVAGKVPTSMVPIPEPDATKVSQTYPRLVGGEQRALEQLSYYLAQTQLLQTYKETRNGLDGWDFSSKLSAWLALGCISSATVAHAITSFEAKFVKNDSTYWLFFELLWREFFYWQQVKHGPRLYALDGIQRKVPKTQHDPVRFEQWCSGNTGIPIVDASMRQLNATGFMSNRTRQLVASCFVHELALDWRYGAAYFEQQLIDYDVASNWGNWQYLAGVGSDPRGHRQFNLDKQTQQYDPKGEFCRKWLSP